MLPSSTCLSRAGRLACLAGALSFPVTGAGSLCAQANQPGVTAQNLERARQMLKQLQKDLHEFYYDSTFHGLDIDAQFRQADSALGSAATNNHMWGIIAEVLDNLKDSHTSFYPPDRVARIDYGFTLQPIGDTCYVIRVKKGSDAEKKGLKVGDAVLALDAFKLERKTFNTLMYVYYTLSPRPGMKLIVKGPDGTRRDIVAMAKITEGERIVDLTNSSTISRLIQEYDEASRTPRHYWTAIGDSVLIWRMPAFYYGDQENINEMMKRAKKHRALILDLRGNGGGAVVTQEYLTGGFFDRVVPIATVRFRKKTDTLVAKPRDKNPFRGMLVILLDSYSASASELTARVMQLEGRAIVVGDHSMGAVVMSTFHQHDVGFGRVATYGASITISDIIMPDGNRLENAGVIPDEIVLPTGADLATKRDPAMARGLALVGVTRTPEEAGLIFKAKDEVEKKP